MDAAAAAVESKGQGVEADSTPVSPRTTPTGTSRTDTPPEEKTTTEQTRRRSSSVTQHPNWRLSLPPEQEQARRNSLSYTHPHPPRRPSSPIPLHSQEQEQDPTAPPPYRPPPIRHHDHDQQDDTPYRPPLHVLTSPWPVTLLPGHHHLPYPFTPTGAAPTPYPSISMPTPMHFPHAPSPLHLQHPPPFPLQSNPFPTHLANPVSPFPSGFPLSPIPTSGLGPASDLQTQQAYLMQALQRESERAERLVARYNALTTAGGGGGKSTRKVKKEIASLKARIDEAGRQERLMMQRLGEVWCEGRERGRWCGMGTGTDGGGGRVGSRGRKASGSVSDGRKKSAAAAVLSPLVAEFVPATAGGEKGGGGSGGKGAIVESRGQRTGGVVFADHDIWGSEEGTGKGSEEEGARGPTSVCDEGEGKKAVEFDDLLWEFESDEERSGKDGAEGSEKKDAQRQRRISMYHAPPFSFKAARDKRMSLPSLKTLWPRSHTVPEADGVDDDGGFF